MSGSEWSEHIRILRINVPDGRGDVLPEGGAEERIIAGGRAAIEEVHVHVRE